MSFLSDLFAAKHFIIKVFLFALVFLAIPYYLISNRSYLLHKISPYNTLENKVAVDDIDLESWDFTGTENQLFLVDTIELSFRQFTNDRYYKYDPVISMEEGRVYFESNKPPDSEYPTGAHFIYYYDVKSHEIHFLESK